MMNVPKKHLFSLRSREIWAVAKGLIMTESWCKFSQHCFFTISVLHGSKERTIEGGDKRKTFHKGWVKRTISRETIGCVGFYASVRHKIF